MKLDVYPETLELPRYSTGIKKSSRRVFYQKI
jgi:hypothetical protein